MSTSIAMLPSLPSLCILSSQRREKFLIHNYDDDEEKFAYFTFLSLRLLSPRQGRRRLPSRHY